MESVMKRIAGLFVVAATPSALLFAVFASVTLPSLGLGYLLGLVAFAILIATYALVEKVLERHVEWRGREVRLDATPVPAVSTLGTPVMERLPRVSRRCGSDPR
jgi:hypothetical protein